MSLKPTDDETTPIPPTQAAGLAVAVRHCGDAMFSQSDAIRELQQSVAEQTAQLAVQNAHLFTLIGNETEERGVLRDILKALSEQGVKVDITALDVAKLREHSQEFSTHDKANDDPEQRFHQAIGKGIAGVVTHKLFPWLATGALAAWHVVRSMFHG